MDYSIRDPPNPVFFSPSQKKNYVLGDRIFCDECNRNLTGLVAVRYGWGSGHKCIRYLCEQHTNIKCFGAHQEEPSILMCSVALKREEIPHDSIFRIFSPSGKQNHPGSFSVFDSHLIKEGKVNDHTRIGTQETHKLGEAPKKKRIGKK